MFWKVHLEGAPKRVNHAAVAVGNFIYSFGGYCKDFDFTEPTPISIYKLSTATYRWKEIIVPPTNLNRSPFQRYGHTAVVYGQYIVIWGGRNDKMTCNKVFVFDTVKNEWKRWEVSGNIPYPRDGHTACVIDDCMYIFGGIEDGTNMPSDDLYCLNLKTSTWDYIPTKGEPPAPRDFHVAVAVGSRMYIYGGRGQADITDYDHDEIYWSEMCYFDTLTKTWYKPVTTGITPIGRRSCSSFVHDGCIYIFGGCNARIRTHFNDLNKFNPRTNEWRSIKAMGLPPSTRRRQCCAIVNDCVFIFGGTRPGEGSYCDSEGMVETDLEDLSDLHVLQIGFPSLRNLCIMEVIKRKLNYSSMPQHIERDIWYMSTRDVITQ